MEATWAKVAAKRGQDLGGQGVPLGVSDLPPTTLTCMQAASSNFSVNIIGFGLGGPEKSKGMERGRQERTKLLFCLVPSKDARLSWWEVKVSYPKRDLTRVTPL